MSSLPTTTTTHVPTLNRPDSAPIRPAPAAASSGGGLSMRNVLAAMLRHLWLVIIVVLVVNIAAWAVFAFCYKYRRLYTATGRMAVTEQRNPNVADAANRTSDKVSVDMRKAEQALLVISESNLDLLLKQSKATETQWWTLHSTEKRGALEYLLTHVSTSQIPNSTFITVSVSDGDATAAKQMCNAIMTFYQDHTRQEEGLEAEPDKRVLQGEKDNIDNALQKVQEELDNKRRSKDFEALERARVEVIDRIAQLGAMLTTQELQTDRDQQMAQGVAGLRNPEAPAPDEVLQEVERDPILANLLARRQDEAENLSQLEITKGPNHPEVVAAKARLQEIEDTITAKRKTLAQAGKERYVAAVEGRAAQSEKLLKDITDRLDVARKEKKANEEEWAQFEAQKKEQERLTTEKQRLDGLLTHLNMRLGMGIPQLKVINLAPEPDGISFPRWEFFVAVGLILGLALAVSLVLLLEMIDSTVRTPRDLSENVRLPLLGFVPLIQGGQVPRRDLARLVVREPISMLAESFRQIRTNLLFSAPVDQLGSIAVTSAARDEGKTIVAANLAITIALSGRRVLLVDANFRRPALAEVFALADGPGLSNVLTNQAPLADAARLTDVPNLTVLPSGPIPPNPAELLGSATMRAFLDQADAEYDLVIFDSPPSLLVSDTMMLATMVDGVVAVVRASTTSRGMVGRLRDQLLRVNARLLGAVLNATRPTRGGYFRKSQQQYEEYHNITA